MFVGALSRQSHPVACSSASEVLAQTLATLSPRFSNSPRLGYVIGRAPQLDRRELSVALLAALGTPTEGAAELGPCDVAPQSEREVPDRLATPHRSVDDMPRGLEGGDKTLRRLSDALTSGPREAPPRPPSAELSSAPIGGIAERVAPSRRGQTGIPVSALARDLSTSSSHPSFTSTRRSSCSPLAPVPAEAATTVSFRPSSGLESSFFSATGARSAQDRDRADLPKPFMPTSYASLNATRHFRPVRAPPNGATVLSTTSAALSTLTDLAKPFERFPSEGTSLTSQQPPFPRRLGVGVALRPEAAAAALSAPSAAEDSEATPLPSAAASGGGGSSASLLSCFPSSSEASAAGGPMGATEVRALERSYCDDAARATDRALGCAFRGTTLSEGSFAAVSRALVSAFEPPAMRADAFGPPRASLEQKRQSPCFGCLLASIPSRPGRMPSTASRAATCSSPSKDSVPWPLRPDLVLACTCDQRREASAEENEARALGAKRDVDDAATCSGAAVRSRRSGGCPTTLVASLASADRVRQGSSNASSSGAGPSQPTSSGAVLSQPSSSRLDLSQPSSLEATLSQPSSSVFKHPKSGVSALDPLLETIPSALHDSILSTLPPPLHFEGAQTSTRGAPPHDRTVQSSQDVSSDPKSPFAADASIETLRLLATLLADASGRPPLGARTSD